MNPTTEAIRQATSSCLNGGVTDTAAAHGPGCTISEGSESEESNSTHFMTQHFRSVDMERPQGLSFCMVPPGAKTSPPPPKEEAPVAAAVALNNSNPAPVTTGDIASLEAEGEGEGFKAAGRDPLDREECQTTSASSSATTALDTGSLDVQLDWSFLKQGRLFGREQEIKVLQEAYTKRLSSSSKSKRAELILVSGVSGTGKTQLVKAALSPLVQTRGYFLLGKFDQLQAAASEPYKAFVAALTQLAVAMEGDQSSPVERSELRQEIIENVGVESCHALVTLVPALGRILQLETNSCATTAHANDSTNQYDAQQDRLKFALTKLIQVICVRKSIVLVADDLQWCDSSSLELLEELIVHGNASPHTNHALDIDNKQRQRQQQQQQQQHQQQQHAIGGSFTVVGICRDNEVPWAHHFAEMLRRLEDERDTTILHILVQPLTLSATNELVACVLRQSPQQCLPLSEIVHEKSEGNAFFIVCLLKALHREGVLMAQQVAELSENQDERNDKNNNHSRIIPGQHRWLWDDQRWDFLVAQHEKLGVVNLISDQIQQLPEQTQRLLMTAACMGAEADANVIATLLDLKDDQLLGLINVAMEEGLMVERLPDRPGRYAFVHDKVEEAAYALIPAAEKPMTHLSLGRALLEGLTTEELDDNIFLVVNQLIGGISLLTNEIDKTGLADFCIRAGKKASQSSDFGRARQYFDVGISLLPTRHWRDEYYLSLELYSCKAESECCAGDFKVMDETIDSILANSRSLNDRMRANLTKIYSLGLRSQLRDAIKYARDVLASLGDKVPAKVQILHLIQQDMKVKRRLQATSVEGIFNMPYLEDQEKMAAMSVLNLLPPYVFCAQPEIFPFISLLMVKLTLKYGISDFSGPAFCYYAVGCIVMNDFESGYKYAKLALRLLERCKGPRSKIAPRLLFHVYGVTFHWKQPLRSTFPALRSTIPVAIDGGDLECAEIIAYTLSYVKYAAGMNLVALDQKLKEFMALMSPQSPWLKMVMLKQQMVDNLLGRSADPTCLNLSSDVDPTCDAQTNFQCYDCWVNTIRLQLGYHFGDIDLALAGGKASRVGESVAKTSYYITFQLFYDGMTCLEQAHFSNRRKHKAWAKKIIKRMKFLAKECPENNLHKVYILEGELCALNGKLAMALKLFSKAVDHAAEQGVTHLQALALERASVVMQRLGNTVGDHAEAIQYMKRAIAEYDSWGAVAIVSHLQKRLVEMES